MIVKPLNVTEEKYFQIECIFRKHINKKVLLINRLDVGVMNDKFRVECISGSYVIRFYSIGGDTKIKYEPYLLNKFNSLGIKSPKIICTSLENDDKDFFISHYIIYEWISGESLKSKYNKLTNLECTNIAFELKEILGQMETIQFDGYGEITDEGKARDNSWWEFLNNAVRNNIESLYSLRFFSGLDKHTFESFLNSQLNHFKNKKISPSFVWADICFENIVINNNNEISGVFDFEYSFSGDTNLASSYFYCKDSSNRITNVFFQKKNEKYPYIELDNDLSFYCLIRLLRISKFLTTDLPTGKARDHIYDIFPGLKQVLRKYLQK